MTPEQFNNLSEGDLIRNKNGHGFFVIRNNRRNSLVAQCLLDIPLSRCEDWTHTAELTPVAKLPPPQAAEPRRPVRPPVANIERILLDIGFAKITDARSTVWRSRNGSDFFTTVEGAWDSLPSHAVEELGIDRMQRFRNELINAGWRRVPDTASIWKSPNMGVKFRGTWVAWTVMKLGQR